MLVLTEYAHGHPEAHEHDEQAEADDVCAGAPVDGAIEAGVVFNRSSCKQEYPLTTTLIVSTQLTQLIY